MNKGRKKKNICVVCRRPCVGKICRRCYERKSNKGHYAVTYPRVIRIF